MKRRGSKRLYPWEVLNSILERGEADILGSRIPGGLTPQAVRNWCREPQSEGPNCTGRSNFLDVARIIIEMVRERDGEPKRAYPIADYVAGLLGGVFVPMPVICSSHDSEFMARTSAVLKETGEAIDKVRQAYIENSPGRVTRSEAIECRKEIDEGIAALVHLKCWIDEMEGQR